jgi:hypothetical protein
MSSAKVPTNFKDVVTNAAPLGYAVNGGMKTTFNSRVANKRRSLIVMNALPQIEGATEFDIINDHYDR